MKRNLLSIIILALLVVNIVLSAIMMISVSSASRKTAALVSDISTIVGLEINGLPESGAAAAVSMADTALYSIPDELTIPLKTGEDGAAHYAVGSVTLSMNSKHDDYATYSETITTGGMDGVIKDIIFAVIGNYTMEEAKDRAGSDQIKAEILSRIQERFGSDFIYEISFSFLYS